MCVYCIYCAVLMHVCNLCVLQPERLIVLLEIHTLITFGGKKNRQSAGERDILEINELYREVW